MKRSPRSDSSLPRKLRLCSTRNSFNPDAAAAPPRGKTGRGNSGSEMASARTCAPVSLESLPLWTGEYPSSRTWDTTYAWREGLLLTSESYPREAYHANRTPPGVEGDWELEWKFFARQSINRSWGNSLS